MKLMERLRCKRHIKFWFICLILYISVNLFKISIRQCSTNEKNGKSEVVILMWTKYYEFEEDAFLKLVYNERKDSDKTCFNGVHITYDRGQLARATAIVIYRANASDIPKTRRADQLWVLYETECPIYSRNLKPFNSLFNWTMTYRKDSDIFAPYGDYDVLDEEKEDVNVNGVPLDEFVSGKSGGLVGVISNCKTHGKRERFLEQLRAEGNLTIDTFGKCGKGICARWEEKCEHGKWWKEVGAKYKFYFAGENSICTDYITEKFWRALKIGVVPLVYGGADYSRFAPPHSFIDVKDFNSTKDVANFLRRLDKDETEYKRYFEWRKKYKVRLGEEYLDTWTGLCTQGWCDLSQRVKDFRNRLGCDPRALQELSKTIPDLDSWWRYEAGTNKSVCDFHLVRRI